GQVLPAEGDGEAFAYAVIRGGQNIGPPEGEHQQHFHGPLSDSANGGEPFDDFFVGQFGDGTGTGHDSLDSFGGDVFDGGGFGAREAGGAHAVVGRGEDVFGCGKSFAGIQGQEAFQDGLRGGAVELL